MPTGRQMRHAKQLFQATLDRFKQVVDSMPEKDGRADLICDSWQAVIDSDELIEKLSSIINFEALVGYQRQFTNRSPYERLLARQAEKSAEIDLAIHILRERRGIALTRISETTDYRTPDFRKTSGNELYEAKYIEKLNETSIRTKASEALAQIEGYANANNLTEFGGTVHIFTYDTTLYGMELQRIMEALKQETTTKFTFPFNLNLQAYSLGVYGDVYFGNLL